jgi:hypothetical protein
MDVYLLLSDDNYHMAVYAGDNGVIDTTTCGVLANDDESLEIIDVKVSASSDSTFNIPFDMLHVSVARPLAPGLYAYLLCDSVHDVEGTLIDGDGDNLAGGTHFIEFTIDNLFTPNAPSLNDYSDVLVALNLPSVSQGTATEFQIERTGDGITAIVGSISLDSLSFVDDNLSCETSYQYRIRLYHQPTGMFSDWSGTWLDSSSWGLEWRWVARHRLV